MTPWTAQAVADLAQWAQYGVLGLVVVALLMGWLVPGRYFDREVRRGDRLEAENERLRHQVEDRVIPLLTRAMDVLDRSRRRTDES